MHVVRCLILFFNHKQTSSIVSLRAAHLSPLEAPRENNGICLCSYCAVSSLLPARFRCHHSRMSSTFLLSSVFIDCVSSSWPCFTCTQLFRTSPRMLSIFYLNWASISLCSFVSILISSSSVTPSPPFSYFIPSLPQIAQRKDLLGQARSPRKPPSSRNQLRMLEERAVPKNITAQVGQSTYLHCIVETIGDKTVS